MASPQIEEKTAPYAAHPTQHAVSQDRHIPHPTRGATQSPPGNRLWKRNLAVLWFGELIAISGFSVFMPFLPFYVQELGISGLEQVAFWSGLLTTAQGVTMAAIAPVWGSLADRYGRKIMVDSYGGIARHGGGCFSGKDPTKVDRSAAYMARYIAKNVVAAGIADRLELQVSYAIGVARPLSLMVETYGTGQISDERIIDLIDTHFDLRPAAIIRDLDLRRPIYKATAAYGHFGRDDIDAPWESTDKAETLRREAGLA